MNLTKSKKKLIFLNKKISNVNFVKKVPVSKFNALHLAVFLVHICYVGI